MLTDAVPQQLAEGDGRLRHPRFAEANLARNLELVQRIEAIARGKGCTTAQLVLAWLLAQGPDIVPIPGTKRSERMIDNLGALAVRPDAADVAQITAAVPPGSVAGDTLLGSPDEGGLPLGAGGA